MYAVLEVCHTHDMLCYTIVFVFRASTLFRWRVLQAVNKSAVPVPVPEQFKLVKRALGVLTKRTLWVINGIYASYLLLGI